MRAISITWCECKVISLPVFQLLSLRGYLCHWLLDGLVWMMVSAGWNSVYRVTTLTIDDVTVNNTYCEDWQCRTSTLTICQWQYNIDKILEEERQSGHNNRRMKDCELSAPTTVTQDQQFLGGQKKKNPKKKTTYLTEHRGNNNNKKVSRLNHFRIHALLKSLPPPPSSTLDHNRVVPPPLVSLLPAPMSPTTDYYRQPVAHVTHLTPRILNFLHTARASGNGGKKGVGKDEPGVKASVLTCFPPFRHFLLPFCRRSFYTWEELAL